MSLFAASNSQSNQLETVTCYQYTFKFYHGEMDAVDQRGMRIQEIFAPPPYSLCFNQIGSFLADQPRNVYKENPFSHDPAIEHPLTELQVSKNILDRMKNLVEQKLKIDNEEKTLNAQLQQYWR